MKEAVFQIKCMGRSLRREPVLERAIDVEVRVYQLSDTSVISSEVTCKHYFKQDSPPGCECSASGTRGIACAYEFNTPYDNDRLIKEINRLAGFRWKKQ